MLETLIQPFLGAALQFIITLLGQVSPEIARDLENFFTGIGTILSDAITLQMTPGEALDSLKIRANELKAEGETLLIQVEAQSEKFPAELVGALTGFLGSSVGALEKVAGL